MTQSIVTVERLGLSFGDTQVVRDIAFGVPKGQIITIVGPSGCGKSSLLRLICGLQPPTNGSVEVAADVVQSFVFQEAALLPWASAEKNVALPLALDGHVDAWSVDTALAQVGLSDWKHATPSQLSGGMRMRVSIARALVRRPDLLLMDEPFAALDELRRFDLAEQVRAIAKDTGLTVVFVTHSVFEACFISDRVLVMSPGPGQIIDDIPVGDNKVRGADYRESAVFTDACSTVSAALRAAAQGSAA